MNGGISAMLWQSCNQSKTNSLELGDTELLHFLSDDQSNYTEEASPPPSSPFDFLKNLQGSQKGQNVKGVKELKEYLKRFGHLNHDQSSSNYLNTNNNNEGGGDGDDDFHEQTESAIRKFQLNYNLTVTGSLDSKTVSKMMMPRWRAR
ncbi:hypothetical protein GH714_037091 [Hevea brasiliensis]|uniref:Peptidoglycan binding-like domain-containing protein n=1 Tax=Hevea brasiliensis TaxID=3981 RepID=A0A6A6L4C2_HEVBR|nr:hypothetical protein GH714_037091 [Hevea brasiliensis]